VALVAALWVHLACLGQASGGLLASKAPNSVASRVLVAVLAASAPAEPMEERADVTAAPRAQAIAAPRVATRVFVPLSGPPHHLPERMLHTSGGADPPGAWLT